MYLLDTNICVYFINQRSAPLMTRFRACDPGDLYVSSITAGELAYGVANSAREVFNRRRLEDFLDLVQLAPWPHEAIWAYGEHKTRLWKAGAKIGELDMLIAAQALSLDATLVTNNTKEFGRVPGLKIENWAEA
jgi:tRNA(fMet)-specific endonuclease VapC